MRKLHLAAMTYERDGILNALRGTDAVEIRHHAETERTVPLPEGGEELRAYLADLESALSKVSAEGDAYARQQKIKTETVTPALTLAEFFRAGDKKEAAELFEKRAGELFEEESACVAEQTKTARLSEQARPYLSLPLPFAAYADTQHTAVRVGIVSPTFDGAALEALGPVALEPFGEHGVVVTAHKSVLREADALLSAGGFSLCPFSENRTGAELCEQLEEKKRELSERRSEIRKQLYELSKQREEIEIYCDFVRFELEKAETGGKLRGTERTFLLEAFVPADREEDVKKALEPFEAVWFEFTDPSEDEFVPTLTKNNKVVENFETITNMYSPPNAREIDPNSVMSFFYSLFIGFIMADIGYGLMMMLGGGYLYYKNRDKKEGIKSLAGVFAFGGIFTVLWGFLFNSLFGIQILPFTVMPDAQSKMWSLVGIDIPAVLIVSLLIGVVQLMAGYFCLLAQRWHVGKYLDGILDGGVWGVFSLGAGIAIVGLVEDFHLSFLAAAGGMIAGAMLLVAVLTAGRHEKFLGKLSKGFSSLYGLINYFTDVLSYIRLYGLMLTGAVIAQIISQYSLMFLTSGSLLIVLGAVLMVVGHVFNLAISLLGAYIHTARLQYVEFFGKFYVGEGELFTPLGSQRKYVSVLK